MLHRAQKSHVQKKKDKFNLDLSFDARLGGHSVSQANIITNARVPELIMND